MQGWLFDVYFYDENVYIWIKGNDGKFYKLSERFTPYFIIDAADMTHEVLSDISEVARATLVHRLFPMENPESRLMIMVEPEWKLYNPLLRKAGQDPRVIAIYDSDLLPVQQFLFTRLKIEPGSAVNFENGRVFAIDDAQLSDPPPFDLSDDIICGMPAWQVNKRDPNDPIDYLQGSCAGRIAMDRQAKWFECSKAGLAWLVERARFSFLPLGLAARWSSNKVIDSRNAFALISKGYAVPKLYVNEPAISMRDFIKRDKGGYTISPKQIGVFENVGVIDFDSEYPNIIIKYGISYSKGSWLLPEVIRPWVERRLLLKRLIRLAKDEEHKLMYKARSDSLKLILVSEYGISGCSLNRFGNHFAFEEINLISRQIMIKAKSIAEQNGFEVIYGDVDSLFVTKNGASADDYERLAQIISMETGLPASLDKIFRVLAFVSKRTDAMTAALKRYFGITESGHVECRGIEARRNDIPEAIRTFQLELIKSVYGDKDLITIRNSAADISSKMLSGFIRRLREGSVPAESLAIQKKLSKDPDKYNADVPQKIAAKLAGLGNGDTVRYILLRNRVSINYDEPYDWKRYALMAFSAACTVMEPLGITPSLEARIHRFQ